MDPIAEEITAKLTKRELKILAICQGYGLVQVSHFVQNIYNRQRDECEKSIKKLVALNLLREDGLISVMPTNKEFVVVETNEYFVTIKIPAITAESSSSSSSSSSSVCT